MRVGYFTNQYPGVSHTFIRREIHALETLGVTVPRYALRSGRNLIDPEDISEQKQTRYVLSAGVGEFIRCCLAVLLFQPLAAYRAIRVVVKLGWHSDRGLLRHIAYFAEAAVLTSWCRRDGVQHIHAHFGTNSAAVSLLASQIAGIPYSFTAHGPDEFEKAELLSLDEKLKGAAFAVCVSSFGRSQLMRWSHADQWRKIAIVHCGVDRPFLDAAVKPPPTSHRLVCVGRIDVQKAQLVLVAAARRLRDAGVCFEIVLIGDGPMRPQVEAAIQAGDLEDKINIVGWTSGDRVKAELSAARALVLPSFAENMPVVIMEALALGRPVISTYVAGIPEMIQPGKTGWLVPAGDEIALAAAMREMLEAPVEQLAAMGDFGRRYILEHHDTLKEAAKLKKLFERQPLVDAANESVEADRAKKN